MIIVKFSFLQHKLKVKIGEDGQQQADYDRTVLSTTIDTCKMSEGFQGTFFAKTLLENISNASIQFKCPLKKVRMLTAFKVLTKLLILNSRAFI